MAGGVAMRKLLKVVGVLFAIFVVVVVGLVVWVQATWEVDYSGVAKPAITASTDPAVIERGAYVVNALGHCQACHQAAEFITKREWGADPKALVGGALDAGPFGFFYSANLTSDAETGLGKVDDATIARAIRHGVDRNGKLAMNMALSIGAFADEDLAAVVSYLRTLPPVRNAQPPSRYSFVSKAVAKLVSPHTETPPPYVAPGGVSVERGRYIANGPAACYGCHTDPKIPELTPGEPRFTGTSMGEPDPTDDGYEIAPPNLTPDPKTGVMAGWTEDSFVARFKKGRTYAGSKMPWESFAQMTDDDLKSVWRYLASLPPVEHATGPSRRPKGST
jgi:mono/diheme cytochrome c family protein